MNDDSPNLPEQILTIFDSTQWTDGIDLYAMQLFEDRLELRRKDFLDDPEKALLESEIEVFMLERLAKQTLGTLREVWRLTHGAYEESPDRDTKEALDYLFQRAGDTWFLYRQTRMSGSPRTVLRRRTWSDHYSDHKT